MDGFVTCYAILFAAALTIYWLPDLAE
jgi:hypothetical protein